MPASGDGAGNVSAQPLGVRSAESSQSCQLLIGLSGDLPWWSLWWLGQKYKGLIFIPKGNKGPAFFPQKGHCQTAIWTWEHSDIPVHHSCPFSSPQSCFPNLPFTHLHSLEPELDKVCRGGNKGGVSGGNMTWRQHTLPNTEVAAMKTSQLNSRRRMLKHLRSSRQY